MDNDNIEDIRSGIRSENIQEVIDAGVSTAHAFQHGQQQYATPEWLATACARLLPDNPQNVLDPQCAGGNLLKAITAPNRFGCDLDNAFAKIEALPEDGAYHYSAPIQINRVTISCVKLASTMKELFPEMKFSAIVANPPFGIRWKQPEGVEPRTIESTAWTWAFIKEHLLLYGYGFFIASAKTIEALAINTDPWAYLYQKFPAGGIWPDCDVAIGIVHFQNGNSHSRVDHEWKEVPSANMMQTQFYGHVHSGGYYAWNKPGHDYRTVTQWNQLVGVIEDEKGNRPKYNIFLKEGGMLGTYLSTRATFKILPAEIEKLVRINDCHPLTLTTERETRKLLNEYLTAGKYTIEPAAKLAISSALSEVASLACPIRPVTDFELVAYADEEDTLLCKDAGKVRNIIITVGKRYEIRTGTYTFKEKFTRKKLHFNEETEETSIEDHQCELSGEDRYIEITDDRRTIHRFMERPLESVSWQHHESLLWELFKEPYVPTIVETHAEKYERNLATMELNEQIAGFTYFQGQKDYYARMACKDYGLIAAATGTGKTLGALTMVALKSPGRTLIIAPQGTMRSVGSEDEIDYEASQWVKEISRFAPTEPVFQIFTREEWRDVLHANGGELPPGIYITYPQAYFSNGSFEYLPDTWPDNKAEQKFCEHYELKYDEQRTREDCFSRNVGASNKHGVRCIAQASLATEISIKHGEAWDMVIMDEAHLVCNLDARVTKNLIRLQPKYRFAMTASPIPNIISNIFSLMGWVCVPQWYKGKIRNAAWPYSVEEAPRFSSTFLSTEVDLTAQHKARMAGKRSWRNVGTRHSPVISSPARLLKLLKPSMAHISLEDCNPQVVPCEVIDVRVPLGKEQAVLYEYWLNRANYIPEFKNPLVIAQVQSSRLRGVCASPASLDYTRGKCKSNFNAKTLTILQVIRDCMRRGEQVTVVSARVGQSAALASRLRDANIPLARIDSTVTADLHTAEANRFKRGDARVMLMGIKCAQGHSFDQCPNLIVGSLEWSYGTFLQAKGRVWRLTSPKPVKVWVILHQNTIEELLFDRVAVKQDAATLCLHGKRVPRDFKTLDASEILAEHVVNFDPTKGEVQSESECESQWPELRRQIVMANQPQKKVA